MDNLKLLLDKTYITTILCDLSYNYYNFINNCIMLPTILGSSILTIMNSSEIDNNTMKIINITLNGLNTVILAISTNYKLNDRINNYKTNKSKIIKLQHIIESYMLKNETITPALLEGFITEYDKKWDDITQIIKVEEKIEANKLKVVNGRYQIKK